MSAAALTEPGSHCSPGTTLYGEIVEFLYLEAELLDSNRFSDWLALLAEDLHYEMPVRTTQFLSSGQGFQEVAFFDDNLQSMRTRVRRLETDTAWAETPPSRTRHFVSNVLVRPASQAKEYAVSVNFLVSRSRGDQGYQFLTGRREDILRRDPTGQLRIARRRILVDQTVLTATNLSILF
jgi:biphenyl 2,3-dioxygenase beta subunit/benzene/toluene dioxygenase beta subunit